MMKRFFFFACFVIACSGGSTSDDAGAIADTGTKDAPIQDTGAKDSSSDSGTNADSGSDSGVAIDSGNGNDTGVQDAGFSLNGCTDQSFVDVSQGNQSTRTVNWDLNQNFPYCFTIAQGQSFVWNTTVNVTFANHPLEAAGGDQNNPIMVTNSGTTVSFQFSNKGNFGFDCQFHPGIMRGVIRVK